MGCPVISFQGRMGDSNPNGFPNHPSPPLFTPKKAVVCTGFTVRAGLPEKDENISGRILDGLNESKDDQEV